MATKHLPSKAPGDVVDYPIDFGPLLAVGETVTAAVSVVEAGLVEASPGLPPFTAAGVVTPILSGGTEGETYRMALTVTTSASRTFQRDFCLTVEVLS